MSEAPTALTPEEQSPKFTRQKPFVLDGTSYAVVSDGRNLIEFPFFDLDLREARTLRDWLDSVLPPRTHCRGCSDSDPFKCDGKRKTEACTCVCHGL